MAARPPQMVLLPGEGELKALAKAAKAEKLETLAKDLIPGRLKRFDSYRTN